MDAKDRHSAVAVYSNVIFNNETINFICFLMPGYAHGIKINAVIFLFNILTYYIPSSIASLGQWEEL